MNLANVGSDPLDEGVHFINFNQDCTSIAVGFKSGYKLYALNNVDNIEDIYENREYDDICIVERLFSSSLVAVVSLTSPRKLKVCHFKKGTEICNYSYANTILAVKLNRARMVVCLEESLYIHNIRDMKVMHTIRDTPSNPNGLCALSIDSDNSYLAYPGSNTFGELQIFDAEHLQAKIMIPAHNNPLAAIAFDKTGSKVATASDKGTVIRVFSVADGNKLFEFRRGVKRCVSIFSLAFSPDTLYLCASSNTETVHIFKLEDPRDANPPDDVQQSVAGGAGGWMGYFGKALISSASFLPTQVSDMLSQGRSFATVHLPLWGQKNICAIAVIRKVVRVLVASTDGYLYMYNLDTNEGGDCTLVKQHRLDGKVDSLGGVGPFGTKLYQTPPPDNANVYPYTPASTLKHDDGFCNQNAPISYADTVKQSVLKGRSGHANVFTSNNNTDTDTFQELSSSTKHESSKSVVGGRPLRLDDDKEFPAIPQQTSNRS